MFCDGTMFHAPLKHVENIVPPSLMHEKHLQPPYLMVMP